MTEVPQEDPPVPAPCLPLLSALLAALQPECHSLPYPCPMPMPPRVSQTQAQSFCSPFLIPSSLTHPQASSSLRPKLPPECLWKRPDSSPSGGRGVTALTVRPNWMQLEVGDLEDSSAAGPPSDTWISRGCPQRVSE